MAENVLLYSPQVKIDAPNEIICTVETAIPVTSAAYSARLCQCGPVTVSKASVSRLSAPPITIRFKISGRFKIQITEVVNGDTYPHVSRWMQAYLNGNTEVPFIEGKNHSGVQNFVCPGGDRLSTYMDFKEGDEISFKWLAHRSSVNPTDVAENTVLFDNKGSGKYGYSEHYYLDFKLGRQVVSVVDGVLSIINEPITDIFDYIEIVE